MEGRLVDGRLPGSFSCAWPSPRPPARCASRMPGSPARADLWAAGTPTGYITSCGADLVGGSALVWEAVVLAAVNGTCELVILSTLFGEEKAMMQSAMRM